MATGMLLVRPDLCTRLAPSEIEVGIRKKN